MVGQDPNFVLTPLNPFQNGGAPVPTCRRDSFPDHVDRLLTRSRMLSEVSTVKNSILNLIVQGDDEATITVS
jgi:hypothetical protein